MLQSQRSRQTGRRLIFGFIVVALFCLFQSSSQLYGQSTGTVSGVVYDPNAAAVPGARIELKNAASGDVRSTITNERGNFTITAIPPGVYIATITAPGFKTWTQSEIVLTQGETRPISNINLQLGSVAEQVNVTAEAEATVPVDTGEVSTTLNNYMVSELAITGRDAGELIKFMPGMGFNNGIAQGSSFTDKEVGTNSGPVGGYSANGTQPNGGMSFLLDGANILDSNMGTQVANVNQDMTSEVKIMTMGYNAEYAKGPVIFEAYGKSGGQTYHGGAYLYARNAAMNSQDWYNKNQGVTKPQDSYYYAGGNVGGPIYIPHLPFNTAKNKLFYWAGYEYMRQKPAGTLYEYFVPTDEMRKGNFSAESMAALPSSVPSGDNVVPCGNSCNAGLSVSDGQIQSLIDSNATALLSLYPEPTVDPAKHGGNNYTYLDNYPQNRWELKTRIDYAFDENTKISGSYGYQSEKDQHSFTVWWAPSSSLPYPSPIVAPTTSNVATLNITKAINPTFTNEAVASYVRYANANKPEDTSKATRSSIGYTAGTLFDATPTQIPNIVSWSGALPGFYAPSFGGSMSNGAFGKILRNASVADNLTKVLANHTIKGGFYWDVNGNEQSTGGGNVFYQGLYDFETYSSTGTGNPIADFLLGRASNYKQANANAVDNGHYHDYAIYAQDAWKITKRLTINYGMRFDHLGQWFFPDPGMQVFVPAAYNNDTSTAPANTGMLWHGISNAIPRSGFKSKFYYAPRGSAAYDVFGNGKTVLRGGYAVFYYPLGDSSAGAAENAMGVYTYETPKGLTSYNDVTSFSPSGFNENGTSVTAMQAGDGRMPHTENYNVTISQATPWESVFEISYIGNRSRNLLIDGSLANINRNAVGAFYSADPVTGAAGYSKNATTGVVSNPTQSIVSNDYHPYLNYQTLTVVSHGSYSNYNAMQMSWHKQQGPITYMANYSFGKVLGIRDGETDNGNGNGALVNPFSLRDNYGVLAYDHTHIVNLAYVINLPKPIHNNVITGGIVNGWELSGATSFQSGAPLQPNTGGSLHANFPSTVTNSIYLGTDAILLEPKITCDPKKNLASGQYFNPKCFAPPDPGTQGTVIWPYIKAPAYWNSDLSLNKNFKFQDTRNIQFRISAFNFLNHPLREFNADGTQNDIRLNFNNNNTLSETNINSATTGKPLYKVGSRLVEVALKFNF
jgi:hypothetical protein